MTKRKKHILENIKTNNLEEADKPRGSLSIENRPDTFLRKTHFQSLLKYCACCVKARRECLTKGKYCISQFSALFLNRGQRYGTKQPEGSVNCRKHQVDPLIIYIPSLRDGDIIMNGDPYLLFHIFKVIYS